MRIKIVGPPGTGKTETLKEILAYLLGQRERAPEILKDLVKDLRRDLEVRDIAVISFSRSAVREFGDRIGINPFGESSEARYWRTFHGLITVLLQDLGKVASWEIESLGDLERYQYRFCKEREIPFSYDPFRLKKGNMLFNEKTKLVNQLYHKRDLKEIVRLHSMPSFWIEWELFKKKHKILDFDDLLMRAWRDREDLLLPTKVIIVDEAQDLTPLQWAILEEIGKGKDIIVAGDDLQSIYQFTGARAKEFMEWRADLTLVLDRSYRLPQSIKAFSDAIAKRIEHIPRKFKPREDIGGVKTGISYENALKLAIGLAKKGLRVFMLTRTNGLAIKTISEVMKRGILPGALKEHRRGYTWHEKITSLAIASKWIVSQEGPIPKENLRIYAYYSVGPIRKAILEVIERGEIPLEYSKLFRKLGEDPLRYLRIERNEREILEAFVREKKEDLRSNLIIDTIHASKGREADYVFLINAIHSREKQHLDEWENELRLLYVGVTRAKKGVLVVTPPRKYKIWISEEIPRILREAVKILEGMRK